MQNKKVLVVLGLGTNLGNKKVNLKEAIDQLIKINIKILKISRVFQTPPWGFKATEDFYNAAVLAETALNPAQLLIELKAIELKMGRVNKTSQEYTSRIIDIDIIDYHSTVFSSPDLNIPHQALTERNFVLYPLKDVNPSYKHPISGKRINELISALQADSISVVNMSL